MFRPGWDTPLFGASVVWPLHLNSPAGRRWELIRLTLNGRDWAFSGLRLEQHHQTRGDAVTDSPRERSR